MDGARSMWRAQPGFFEAIGCSWTLENVGEMQLARILASIGWSLFELVPRWALGGGKFK